MMIINAFHISTALAQLGVPAARSRILQAGGRTFLEVDRFDRHGAHGRSPVCSWQAVGNALLGDASGAWPEVGKRLQQHGLITPRMAEEGMRVFDAYLGLYLPPLMAKRSA